jgi:hypothetical protein
MVMADGHNVKVYPGLWVIKLVWMLSRIYFTVVRTGELKH